MVRGILLLLVLALATAWAIYLIRAVLIPALSGRHADDELDLRPAGPLMDREMRRMHAAIQQAVGREWWIAPRMPLRDAVAPTRSERSRAFADARLDSIRCDFLILDLEAMRPALVIEVDPDDKPLASRRAESRRRERACEAADVPFLRVSQRDAWDVPALRTKILRALRHEPTLRLIDSRTGA